MKTVLLCGGKGTRIRGVADDIPKPMIQLNGYPILWHIMKYYSVYNYNEFILCLGYKGQVIKDFFLNYESYTRDLTIKLGEKKSIEYHNHHDETDWDITLAETGNDALTGARVKRVQKYLKDDDNFMLTYGDGVGDINIEALVDFHMSHGKILTVTGVRPPARFGEIVYDDGNKIIEFNEKPQATAGRISGGFFVCRKEIFNYLDDREDLTFEQEPIKNLVNDGEMMIYKHDGFWQPMDTFRDYSLLKNMCEKNAAPWVIWK